MLPQVLDIMEQVKTHGDETLYACTERYDRAKLNSLRAQLSDPCYTDWLPDEALRAAIDTAIANIETFHQACIPADVNLETMPGVRCMRRAVPISRVGLYIPGGTAPLLSTLIMLAVPATLAGCRQMVLCTPPGPNGTIHPAIAHLAIRFGISEVYTIGGAQAIAAMTYGTETIAPVDNIFGPGNAWVTLAKQMAQQYGTAIDMPAGPSEVLIIADATSNPRFVAADLLSQAEHGYDSMAALIVSDQAGPTHDFERQVQEELSTQCALLPRRKMAQNAMNNSFLAHVHSDADAMNLSNLFAPEHLILAGSRCREMAGQVTRAGSVFIGPYSCESAGDYASGTNHTLPTNGFAKSYIGVSVESFMNKITFQELSPQGLADLAPAINALAVTEGLQAHARAVSIRLENN
jgi:histidinol dehydrogenase